jgi:hypothetical protein
MPRPLPVLIALSRGVLHMNQQMLADLVGSSLRTVQRWETSRTDAASWHVHRIADAVRPHDAALASELDTWAPRPAAPVPPEKPPSPPAPEGVGTPLLVDSIVCATAEAMSLPPQAVRPALLAAFSRALALGLPLSTVVIALSPPKEKEEAAREKKAAKRG